MISDEEIKRIALSIDMTVMSVVDPIDFIEKRNAFARATYNLGRQHQRESNAALCERDEYRHWRPRKFAEAIRNNTGELK